MKNVLKSMRVILVASTITVGIASARPAAAQLEAYTTVVFTNRQTNPTNQNPVFTSAGIGAGAFYDGHRFKGVSVGVDVRGSIAPNDKFGMVGFRAALQPRHRDHVHPPFRPYAEMLVGGGTTTDISFHHDAHMVCEGVLGGDFLMGPFDFRIFEVGVGKTPLDNSTGASYSGGNLWVVTTATGVVYHF